MIGWSILHVLCKVIGVCASVWVRGSACVFVCGFVGDHVSGYVRTYIFSKAYYNIL